MTIVLKNIFYYYIGDDMKKIKPFMLAIFIGSICAVYLFKYSFKDTYAFDEYNAIALQIGVFMKENYAQDLSNRYGGVIDYNDGVYRVYYTILNNEENIEYMENYLKSQSISYSIKKVYVSKEVLNEIKTYEDAMNKTDSLKAKLNINKKILSIYERDV